MTHDEVLLLCQPCYNKRQTEVPKPSHSFTHTTSKESIEDILQTEEDYP